MVEKRLYHRMKIELPVSFEIGGDKNLVIATTMDISAKGLALKLEESVKVGQKFKMTIGTDEDRFVKVDAEVVWVRAKKDEEKSEYMVGLKIVDKMDQDEIEFVRFVARKMFEYFKPSDS